MRHRIVLDCMVFVQAVARKHGPSARVFSHATSPAFELVMSDEITAEVTDVLNRPKLLRTFIKASPQDVSDFLVRLALDATRIDPVPAVFDLKRDPDDSKVLNLAIAAGAELIVSRDNDLLDLMTANDADSVMFRTNYPTIRVLDPVAFLQTLPPVAPNIPPTTTP